MKKSPVNLIVLAVMLFTLIGFACKPASTPAPAPPSVATKAPAAPTTAPTVMPTEKPKPDWEVEWEKTLAAAKQEGTLMIYSTPSGDIIRALADAFEKKYGIKVEFVNGRGEELTQRLQAEKSAGLKVADIIMSGGTTTQTVMKPRGLLGKLDAAFILPDVKDPKSWIGDQVPWMDKDHTGFSVLATFQQYVLVNTTTVPQNEITSYKDLLNPKYKGQIVINDPTVTGTGNAFFNMLALDVWTLEETKEFMRKFVEQEPAVTRDRRVQGEWVARGNYPISVATNMETAIDFIRLGSPIAFAKIKEGGKVGPGAGGLSIAVEPAHPNAAKIYINWFLSSEGHSVFVKTYGSPGSRKDAPTEGIPPEMIAGPGDKFYLDTEESILYR
ncbi:MAG: extracellular solute-binding protein, partial [Dehalococcoidia bacterium]|nr:extracellular solute-binding protein [Dehalococcoidia bacterium]